MNATWQSLLLLLAVGAQAGWPRALRPAGVAPDLALVVIILAGLSGRPTLALVLALVAGTLLDLLSSLPAGTHVVSHLAAAGIVWLATAGPLRERPWLVLPLPPLVTAGAYLAAAARLQVAGWPGVWSALLDVLPVAVALVSFVTFAAWLVVGILGTLRPRPVRL